MSGDSDYAASARRYSVIAGSVPVRCLNMPDLNVLTKICGGRSARNVVKAVMDGLLQLRDKAVASQRGVESKLKKGGDNVMLSNEITAIVGSSPSANRFGKAADGKTSGRGHKEPAVVGYQSSVAG